MTAPVTSTPPEPPTAASDELALRLDAHVQLAQGVAGLELVRPDGGELPAWTPGAHIDLVLGDGLVRQYSLCGDPADRQRYRVAVLHVPGGRGGSAFVHEQLAAGAQVTVRGPRNHFPLEDGAGHYRFVAGGIGITPILAMVREAQARGVSWDLVYGGRERASMAFLDELAAYADKVTLHPQDELGHLDLEAIVGAAPPSAAGPLAIYSCGPEPLLAALEARCASAPVTLHLERFAALPDTAPKGSFEIVLDYSGLTLHVPPDKSILEVVEAAGIEVESSCREGTCGTCECYVLEGTPDHRDAVLSPEEQAEGDVMMICRSRALSSRLVLDL